jgi:SAM-dependent methyltransferase
MHKVLLGGTYFPDHVENRMAHEGDVEGARAAFLERRPATLEMLLTQRFSWMGGYLTDRDVIVELGCGAGLSKHFIGNERIVLTDVETREWVDRVVDAMAPDFADGSVDAFVCSHMIHHLYSPVRFFEGVRRKLKLGGLILIQEINTSLLMRVLLRIMRHEGWSYDVDVFDPDATANDRRDPWSANCAIPELLFSDAHAFEAKVDGFEIVENELNEFLLFPLSGGVVAKTWAPELPQWLLRGVTAFDKVAVGLLPSLCAFGRSVVLRRTH